ncbi:hypothetical protein [Sinomonas sp. B1-1]|uniref:hypothetical protein n=1 Tax=Sinomonas sp. B1-1 TaxID=3141454 RepID=UPI003D275C8E
MAHFPLLAAISRLRPEIWDAIIPHGPVNGRRVESVALNPQPLPPKDPHDIAVGAVSMANRVVHLAIEAQLRGENPAGWVGELVEDWCGTPWPRRWPWPWPGPRPDEGPFPEPWRIQEARIVGAIVFASAASRLGESDLRSAFRDGAERLAEAGLSG